MADAVIEASQGEQYGEAAEDAAYVEENTAEATDIEEVAAAEA